MLPPPLQKRWVALFLSIWMPVKENKRTWGFPPPKESDSGFGV